LRRLRRRHHLHGSAGLPGQDESGILAIRYRGVAGIHGDVRAHWAVRDRRKHRPAFRQGSEAVSVAALEIQGLHKSFGALQVTRDVTRPPARGARHALIGPNGAGKTTLVNLITGVLRPSAGKVLLNGEDITALAQARRIHRGIARTFQINQLFRGLTVLENLYLAIGDRTRVCNRLWRPAGAERAVIEEALGHLGALKLAGDALKLVRERAYRPTAPGEVAVA